MRATDEHPAVYCDGHRLTAATPPDAHLHSCTMTGGHVGVCRCRCGAVRRALAHLVETDWSSPPQ
jgi:hypothetical protein